MLKSVKVPRRTVLKGLLAQPTQSEQILAPPDPSKMLNRVIPKSKESIPAMGLGTYESFGTLGSTEQQTRLTEVLSLFAESGGRCVDTSPMYSEAEDVLGVLLPKVEEPPKKGWFLATKVWTDGRENGLNQIAASKKKMKTEKLDLNQIHNLRDWKIHLPSLKEEKAQGNLRYIGATTWGGLDHEGLEKVMKTGDLDFIQVTYNLIHRKIEKKILPLAQDLGIAVIVNRPFSKAALFSEVRGKPVPTWLVKEAECRTWAQAFLKFVLSDPRVTVAIPATSKPKHLVDNMWAGVGPLLDRTQRDKLASMFQ